LAGTSWWNAASTGDDELDRNPSIWMMNDDYGDIYGDYGILWMWMENYLILI